MTRGAAVASETGRGGNTRPPVYWISAAPGGRLAIMPKPRGGAELVGEIAGWKSAGIGVVVSLLEAEEITQLGLGSEPELCRRSGIEFVSFPVKDFGVPASMIEALRLAQAIAARLRGGKAVAIHCHGGVGRSGLLAACALVLLGSEPAAALERVAKARGKNVPETAEQKEWIMLFHDAVGGEP